MTNPPLRPHPTILVVDDSPANLHAMQELLKSDYQVKLANCGVRALEIMRASPPDLVLLDVLMPDIDGYGLCREIKRQEATRDIPVMFLTARADPADEEHGLLLGAVDYITKPISPPVVLARIRVHMRLRTLSQHLHTVIDNHTEEIIYTRAQFSRVVQASLELNAQTDYQAALQVVLNSACSIASCDACMLFVRTPVATLQLAAQTAGLGSVVSDIALFDSATQQPNLLDACARCLHLHSVLLLDQVTQQLGVAAHYQTDSALVVPLPTANGEISGVLYLFNRNGHGSATGLDGRCSPFIEAHAAQSAAALQRLRGEDGTQASR